MKTLREKIEPLYRGRASKDSFVSQVLTEVLDIIEAHTNEQATEIERLNEELSKVFTVAEVRELEGAILKFSSKAEMNSSGFSRDAVVTDVIVDAFDNFLKEPK